MAQQAGKRRRPSEEAQHDGGGAEAPGPSPRGSAEAGQQARKKSATSLRQEHGVAAQQAPHQTGRNYTVSIAVAGSIIDNAQSMELATALAGQIARAAAIFQVDEVVVFDEGARVQNKDASNDSHTKRRWRLEGDTGAAFLARILQYLETPQYLRRTLIPMHPSLRFVGLLPPLDAPHHLRANEQSLYREGVVTSNPNKINRSKDAANGDIVTEEEKTSLYADVGLLRPVRLQRALPAGVRVTVRLEDQAKQANKGTVLLCGQPARGVAVSPAEPRLKQGLYWGYTTRLAQGLSAVFSECPWEEGYDYSIGTSDKGEFVPAWKLQLPEFKHLVVCLGGLAGLEESVELDDSIEVKDTPILFDKYLNTCPEQGSRTIRTEEALLISLSYFQATLMARTQ
eukprot:jgi/Chlat1/8147/Chrsp76S07605